MKELGVLAGILVVVSAIMAAMGYRGREQIVGIDLGTTFSVVALRYQGKIKVVPNHVTGKLLVPSVVTYQPDGSALVGQAAVEQRSLNPLNTIYNSKRFIGRSLKEVTNDTQSASYQIGQNPDPKQVNSSTPEDEILVGFQLPGAPNDQERMFYMHPDGRWVSPVDVGAEVVKHLKKQVYNFMGYQMHRAVICVPAKFGARETEATRKAFQQAGFKVMRIIDEPTAAAVAYNLHKSEGVKNVLVYDIGGGTLDASVLMMHGKTVNVLGIAGDEHLGGSDFDQRVYTLLTEKLPKAASAPATADEEKDATISGCQDEDLRVLAEQIKKQLSNVTSADAKCRDTSGAIRTIPLTRKEFETASQDLFDRALAPVKKVLSDQVMEPRHINDVVLVGGASRTPRLRELLKEYFGEKTLHTDIDPDVTVAYGAANIID
eukprot:gnl/MRDRNA2_/MRDRNA2_115173_c0_seq1.p1 gnl/MRDRNA2_/MRDRNA2_115173_c0~~gnl/MRDRNA2_/MRDRNA2_115173_c0_seq1.p1  ORF type:complete len:432 (-),score=107.86 gnl/MRDRNA2_/MRDRNA2_115173_c0_seq1:176-1471(-)